MGNKRVSERDINKIVERYINQESSLKIAKDYPVSNDTIRNYLRARNVEIRPSGGKEPLDENDVDEAVNLYKQGKSLKIVADYFSRCPPVIRDHLLKRGVQIRPTRSYRKHELNEDYFEQSNEPVCYWIGFLLGDGTITYNEEKPQYNVRLEIIDEEHVRKLRNALNSDSPIHIKENGSYQDTYYINFYSKKLCQSIMKRGVVPNKSHKMLRLPDVPDEFERHLIRGIFDADGCVSASHSGFFSFSGCKPLLDDINKKMDDLLGHQNKVCVNGNTHSLTYSANDDLNKIHDYLYENSTVWLERKKRVFGEIL